MSLNKQKHFGDAISLSIGLRKTQKKNLIKIKDQVDKFIESRQNDPELSELIKLIAISHDAMVDEVNSLNLRTMHMKL